jgi:alanine racemase
MAGGILNIDLDALVDNWRDLAQRCRTQTGATVKADAYGLGMSEVASALARAGARQFFVALAEEGAALRRTLGAGPDIFVFSGHMAGDTQLLRNLDLTPVINSAEQLALHLESLPGHPFAIQLDTGMNRLGMEAREWHAVREIALQAGPRLILSHLACADEPDHLLNAQQRDEFVSMTEGCACPRSLSATGGILLGQTYHFDLTRPGIGLYGGAPFEGAKPVVRLTLPVIQCRDVEPGEGVGYSMTWVAGERTTVATLAAGYADGLLRSLSNRATLWAGDIPCPLVGRVSMDLITVEVGHLPEPPTTLDLICPAQGIDDVAQMAGTIGYEVLTSLGPRYRRRYIGGKG